VEEVVTRSEYTSAVSSPPPSLGRQADQQETGAVLRPEEIGHAFQFGNESSIKNILEKNWWESDAQLQENQMIADEVLKRDEERRRRRDEGEEMEEEDEAMEAEPNAARSSEEKPKVVAKTRVSRSRSVENGLMV